jgi:hypothetical protein
MELSFSQLVERKVVHMGVSPLILDARHDLKERQKPFATII